MRKPLPGRLLGARAGCTSPGGPGRLHVPWGPGPAARPLRARPARPREGRSRSPGGHDLARHHRDPPLRAARPEAAKHAL